MSCSSMVLSLMYLPGAAAELSMSETSHMILDILDARIAVNILRSELSSVIGL